MHYFGQKTMWHVDKEEDPVVTWKIFQSTTVSGTHILLG